MVAAAKRPEGAINPTSVELNGIAEPGNAATHSARERVDVSSGPNYGFVGIIPADGGAEV